MGYLIQGGGHLTIPNGISPKMNTKIRLEFELAYSGVKVQLVSPDVMGLKREKKNNE